MKKQLKSHFIFLLAISIFLVSTSYQIAYSQTAKKEKVRLKADYVKIMKDASYLNISASAKKNKKNVDVSDIDLIISSETEDEEIEIGTLTTNMHGKGTFVIKNLSTIKPDSSNTYNFNITFKGNDTFKKTSKDVRIKDATIKAKIIEKDSVNYVSAQLSETSNDSLLSDEILDVQVQRLFKSLKIGDEFSSTDENGTVIVPIEEGIPGVNGKLIIEVVLDDHDLYGTVKAMVNAPTDTVIVDESTFDQRKMWSSRNKTPLFLLIFPNIIIFGIWAFIIYLFINLFKISKT